MLKRAKDSMKHKTFKITRPRSAVAAPPVDLGVKSILVPIDFSPPSKNALAYAVAVARRFRAKLTLLHVVEPMVTPDFAASFPLAMENDKLIAAARNELESVVKAGRIPRGTVEKTLVRFGR